MLGKQEGLGNLEYLRRIRGTFIDAKVGTLKWKAEPKLLYCSESWALNTRERRRVKVFNMHCIRRTVGMNIRDRLII